MQTDDASLLEFSEDAAELLREVQSEGGQIAPAPEAPDEARGLLRWLRNLQSTELDIESWLELGAIPEQLAKGKQLKKLIRLFLARRAQARKEDEAIRDAGEAACALALAVGEMAWRLLPEGHSQAAKLDTLIEALPPQAELRQSQSALRLIDTLSLGMDRAGGKPEKAPYERLLESSQRLEASKRKLRSVESMEPPAREESIELAREILRRLKNLSFSDKPIESMIDAGRPEDKAAFAQKLDEVADLYKNLLAEAAQGNPSILQNQQIRDAQDAVSIFTHAVKLMASKEIPVSISAAQQISADVTQTPEEWDKLHDRIVGRLIKSMEGGLEKAVGDIEAQQEQQRDQEQGQEAADAALAQTDSSRRRRRRRRRSRSGGGGKKQQKEQRDLTADDYVLKQGRFARDAGEARSGHTHQPMTMPGLPPEALAAVRALGGSLFKVGEQARDLAATMASVSPDDKIAPDDKTISQRVIEEQQKGPKPGRERPRV